jgi:phage terminase large subunit-like protein
MGKLYRLAPKDELDPRCGFDPGRGITGKPPRLVFTAGPGAGSVVSFGTYRQGANRLAGSTLHRIYGDEPMPERYYGEIVPRAFRHRARIRLGFTPTPDMPDVSYLRAKVESGKIREHNYGLTEANCWPRGAPTPWTTEAAIQEFEASLLEVEREMRMGRSWVPLITGRWLASFTDANVRTFELRDLAGAFLTVGVDHGAAAGKQAAVLVALQDRSTPRPRAYIVDEYVVEGITTPENDADAILAMLRRHGLSYDDVDQWVGDKPAGSDRYAIRKSNRDLRRELAAALQRPVAQCHTIITPHKWAGSLTYGMRILDNLARRRTEDGKPHLLVHPRCEVFARACREFDGDPQHPLKDPLDAGRYAVERGITAGAGLALRVLY